MKPFIILLTCLLLCTACTRNQMSREELIKAINDAADLVEFTRSEKAAGLVETQAYEAMMREQMKDLSPATMARLKETADKGDIYVAESWSVDEFIANWNKAYYADFTDSELRDILARVRSPAGQKEILAGKRATIATRKFIFERSFEASRVASKMNTEETARILAEEYRDKYKK